jgi:hypothetical protein
MQSVFWPSMVKVGIKNRKIIGKIPNLWKLNNMCLNNMGSFRKMKKIIYWLE